MSPAEKHLSSQSQTRTHIYTNAFAFIVPTSLLFFDDQASHTQYYYTGNTMKMSLHSQFFGFQSSQLTEDAGF